MKTTFLFVNESGDWESVALRVKAEGYPIYYFKKKGMTKGREDTGLGLFEPEELVDDMFECLVSFKDNKNDLIILVDDSGEGSKYDYLHSEGWSVIGSSDWCDEIEHNRALGLDVMKSIGLDTPYEMDFDNIDDGVAYMESEEDDARYVFKPHGSEFAGGSRTYTAKNKQDLIDYLKWTKSDMDEKHTDIQKFVLQEFIEGIEADFAGYFNGREFLKDTCIIDIEEKKSGDGNKGSATGCMGNIIINLGKVKYFDYLEKLTPMLKECGYVGEISINNIFAAKSGGKHKEYIEGKPYGIEFTPRFGWDAHLTEMAILKDSGLKLGEFYIALAREEQYKIPVGKVGCGVRIYCGSVDQEKSDVAGKLFSFDRSVAKNLWFYGVSRKKGEFIMEDNPVVLVQTVGKNLNNTIADCYALIKDHVNLPDAYYRMEIGKRAEEVLKFLKTYGWI